MEFPALFIIDHAGAIRHKWTGKPGEVFLSAWHWVNLSTKPEAINSDVRPSGRFFEDHYQLNFL
jgi:hypothetical protein